MRSARVDDAEIFVPGFLTARDRCDRCGSQAYVSVNLPSGTLQFCAHHFQEHEARLLPVATSVHDERDRLHAVS